MFDFIKKLFKTEPEQVEELNLDKAKDFVDKKLENIDKDILSSIGLIKTSIDEDIQKTKESLENLKEAELQNPKITQREIDFMKGNRTSYIKTVEILLKQIDLEDKDSSKLLDFCNFFEERINSFGKSTIRSYAILQEFFAHESQAIAQNIKNIDTSIKKLKQIILDSNVTQKQELKDKIKEIQNKIIKKQELEKELKEQEKELKDLKENLQKTKKQKQDFEQSKEFSDYNTLIKEKDKLDNEIKKLQADLSQYFSTLDSAFKKYQRISFEDEKLISAYLKNNFKALLDDKGLAITNILANLKNNIENNKIDLKDKKRKKSLETINQLTKDFFSNILDNYNTIDDKKKNIIENINKLNINEKINKIKDTITGLDDKITDISTKITNNKNELEKIHIEKLKAQLEKKINETLKMNIKLISDLK